MMCTRMYALLTSTPARTKLWFVSRSPHVWLAWLMRILFWICSLCARSRACWWPAASVWECSEERAAGSQVRVAGFADGHVLRLRCDFISETAGTSGTTSIRMSYAP